MAEKQKFADNLADAVSSIQGQLDQLLGEVADNESAVARVKSIKNQLAQIAPEAPEA